MNPEIAVLGAVLLSNGQALDDVNLTPAEFNDPKLAKVFETMTQMRKAHEPIDPITVGAKMPEHLADVWDWQSMVPAWETASYYAQAIRDAAVKRELSFSAQRITHALSIGADTIATIDQARRELGQLAERTTHGTIEYISNIAVAHLDTLQTPRVFMKSPWPKLNEAIMGFRPGAMYVIGARPGVGKTVVGLQVAYELSKLGPVSFHSLEMSKAELLNRLYAQTASVYLGNIERGKLDEFDWKKMAIGKSELSKSSLAIIDKGGQTINDIRSHARTLQQNGGLKAIVIDYIGLIRDTIPGRKRYEAISDFSVELKTMARDFEVPVIALAQLNRNSEARTDKMPQLSDLRDSGAIEQDADVVMLLSRHRGPNDAEFEANEFIIDVAKNRHGFTGEVHLKFNGGCARVETPAS